MVVAENAAASGEGVFVEVAGPLVVAQLGEVDGEVVGGGEGVGVVVAEGAAASVEGVLVQFASPLEFAQLRTGRRRGCRRR